MLAGGKLRPVPAYFVIAFGDAFLFTFGDNILILWQTNIGGLSAGQLLTLSAVTRIVIMVSEVPTGIIADTIGRRVAVVCGFAFLGMGLLVSALQAEFITLLIGDVIISLGVAFLSGAHQAWIADEIGVEKANPVYVTTGQFSMWMWAVAVPLSVLLSVWDVRLPLLFAGASLLSIAFLLTLVMPETGFRRTADESLTSVRMMARGLRRTYFDGLRLIRGRRMLVIILVISAFYGVVGIAFQRLWLLHFNTNIGFPDTFGLDEVAWFGVIRTASALLSVALLEIVRRRGDGLTNHTVVVRSLFVIQALQLNAILLMALTTSFWLACVGYCATFALSYAYDPYYIAWLNQNVSSNVRATVISMNNQSDALGRVGGAPILGFVSAGASVRAALSLAGLALIVPLLLYLRVADRPPDPITDTDST